MRGTRSRLSAVTDRSARAGRTSAAVAGWKRLTRTAPLLNARASVADGRCTLATTSLSASVSARVGAIEAPAAV
jgi:hypothetical protein